MKKIYLLIATTALCLVNLSSCKDLDKYPQDAVSSETYFKTADQLEQYSNQFYTLFPSAPDLYGEVNDHITAATLPDEMMGSRVVPVDASGTKWNWTMLRHINYLLEHIDQCTNENAKIEYSGLAYFFRAYFYFEKVRYYGDVPLVLHTLGSSDKELYMERTSRTIVTDSILKDLDNAIAMLPHTKSSNYRVNAYTAMALKSRVCLFEGTYRKYHGIHGDSWQTLLRQGAAAAEELMNTNVYKLHTTKGTYWGAYRDLFAQGHFADNSDEIILARHYSAESSQSHNMNSYTVSSTTGKPGFTKRFVNQYLMADGSRFTDKYPDNYDIIPMGTEMTDRDGRLEQTIYRPGQYVRVGATTPESDYSVKTSSTGYQLIKYVMEEEHDNYGQSDCDVPLFRYAEVLLNYAECLAELDQFTSTESAKSIDLLRARAGITTPLNVGEVKNTPCQYMSKLYPNAKNNGLVLEIRRERNVELIMEGFHYWDLMRWKEGKSLEQPLLGMGFKGVSKNKNDKSGCVNIKDTSPTKYQVCLYLNPDDRPKSWGVSYLKIKLKIDDDGDVMLTNGLDGGNILCHPESKCIFNEENDRDYLYPIPQQEIILSKGAIKQNPGW